MRVRLKVPTLFSKKALGDLESTILTATIRKGDDEIIAADEEERHLSVRTLLRINQVDLRERFDAFRENRKNAITITSEYERVCGKDGLTHTGDSSHAPPPIRSDVRDSRHHALPNGDNGSLTSRSYNSTRTLFAVK